MKIGFDITLRLSKRGKMVDAAKIIKDLCYHEDDDELYVRSRIGIDGWKLKIRPEESTNIPTLMSSFYELLGDVMEVCRAKKITLVPEDMTIHIDGAVDHEVEKHIPELYRMKTPIRVTPERYGSEIHGIHAALSGSRKDLQHTLIAVKMAAKEIA